VRLCDVVARVRPLMEHLAEERAITAVCDVPSGDATLCTDPVRLEQVLTNLLTNAFKFTAAGSVTLRVRDAAAAGLVRFEVADTGTGIPEAEVAHVFDEFRQVDGSMSRAHGGMGLGLALVRRLVELLGGEVSVTSTPGVGSTFAVTLPAVHASRGLPAPAGDRGRRSATGERA